MHITIGEMFLYILCFAGALFWLSWINKNNSKQDFDEEQRKQRFKK